MRKVSLILAASAALTLTTVSVAAIQTVSGPMFSATMDYH